MDITARHGVYESLTNNKSSKKLIISLAGVGDLRLDEIRFESQASIAEGVPEISSIFVRDTSRSWYTNEDGFDGLVEHLRTFIDQQEITDVTVYGVSMGGYGAIVLATYINANRAIAISPRTLLGPSCKFDPRLYDYASKLKDIRHEALSTLSFEDLNVTIISSIDIREDAAHASLMVGTRAQVLGAHGEHNVSLTLKQKGLLPDFVRDCTKGSIDTEKYGFFEISEDLAKLIDLDIIKKNQKETMQLIDNIPDSHAPSFAHKSLYRKWLNNYIESSDGRNFETRHAYPAHTGQIIDGSNLIPYLESGWAGPEKFGVWGVGLFHSLRFELIDMPKGGRALIVVNARAFIHANVPPVKLIAYINGVKSSDTTCTTDQIQFEAVVCSPMVKIDLYTENPCSPYSAGISDDRRELSIAITKISIYPRPTPP